MKDEMNKLVQVALSIEQKVNTAVDRWCDLPDQTLRFRPSEDTWSIKEITGCDRRLRGHDDDQGDYRPFD